MGNTFQIDPTDLPGSPACKRCGTPFDKDNYAVECPDCDRPTLCKACAEDHSCCQPDGIQGPPFEL